MKIPYFILLFSLLIDGMGIAQDRFRDSLQTLLGQHPQPDTVRLKVINELVYHKLLLYGAFDKDRLLADEALHLAKRWRHKPEEVKALGNIARYLAKEGNASQAIDYAQQALKLAQRTGKKELVALSFSTVGRIYVYSNYDLSRALTNFQQALKLAEEAGDYKLATISLRWLGRIHQLKGNYPQAFDFYLKELPAAEQSSDPTQITYANIDISQMYVLLKDYSQALQYQLKAKEIAQQLGTYTLLINTWNLIGKSYQHQGKFAEATNAYQQSLLIAQKHRPQSNYYIIEIEGNQAEIYEQQGKYSLAKQYAFRSLNQLPLQATQSPALESTLRKILASIYLHTGKIDSARIQGEHSLQLAQGMDFKTGIRDSYQVLSQVYAKQKDYAKAYKYQHLFIIYKDSLSLEETTRQVTLLEHTKELERKEANIALLKKDQQLQTQATQRQRQLFYGALVGLGLLVLLAVVLLQSNRAKQRANALLRQQKAEIDHQAKHLQLLNGELSEQKEEIQSQRDTLQNSLITLQTTQAQLVQREKMASLGELTAGIAHEIQNPLNFVNNFSEVSAELVEELKEGPIQQLPNVVKEEAESILSDLEQNLEKIHCHGKRADSIVKGMLQHSRATSGEKQLTDINALVDEYLRLAYHGLRAKDKDFNVEFTLEADPDLGKIEVAPQEIGRVLLNLYNNAFYATQQKKQQLNGQYMPEVRVSTKAIGDKVEIRVKDNGIGIPESVKSKIFHPFFTTKPTGEGTGLGLSLSYDIVTKGHGGELRVDSQEGEFTELTMTFPSLQVIDSI